MTRAREPVITTSDPRFPPVDREGGIPCSDAIQARVDAFGTDEGIYSQGPRVLLEPGTYLFDKPVYLDRPVIVEGSDSGVSGTTKIVLASGVAAAFVIQPIKLARNYDPEHPFAGTLGDGAIIRNLMVRGASHADRNTVGILGNATGRVENVTVYYCVIGTWWQGETVNGSNCNRWRCDRVFAYHCDYGFATSGSDSGAGVAINCSAMHCRKWGFFDGSQLGCKWDGCHGEANGTIGDPDSGDFKTDSLGSKADFGGCYSESAATTGRGYPNDVRGSLVAGGILALCNTPSAKVDTVGNGRSALGFRRERIDGTAAYCAAVPLEERHAALSWSRVKLGPSGGDLPTAQQPGSWDLCLSDSAWASCQTVRFYASSGAPANPQANPYGRALGWTDATHPLGPAHPVDTNSRVNSRHGWAHKYALTLPAGKSVWTLPNSWLTVYDEREYPALDFALEGDPLTVDARVGAYQISPDPVPGKPTRLRIAMYNDGAEPAAVSLLVKARTVRVDANGW